MKAKSISLAIVGIALIIIGFMIKFTSYHQRADMILIIGLIFNLYGISIYFINWYKTKK